MQYQLGTHKGKTIGARKIHIDSVSKDAEFELLEQNHIQGKLLARSSCIGAYHNDKLVAILNWRLHSGYLEITRYCCDTENSYPGLFSKMLKHMIRQIEYKGDIVSFSNNDHSNGNVYQQAGVRLDKILGPAYWYTRDFRKLENRQQYMKAKIAKRFNIDMSNKTEWQAMQELGYARYWDSGKIRWVMSV